jgi:DNA-binding NtrC family response regulator
MSDGDEFLSRAVKPEQLLLALTVSLKELEKGDIMRALGESMHHAQKGLDAKKALLLYVREHEPEVKLDVLYSAGLDEEQIHACRELRSLEGVSPSLIRKVIETREVQFIADSEGQRNLHKTSSLRGAHSVIAAPVIDPTTHATLAVLYFQNPADLRGFEESDKAFAGAYATALSQGFGLHQASVRQIERLEADKREMERRGGAGAPEIIGDSEATRSLIRVLHDSYIPASTRERPKPILVLGPSGAGKDLIARYLHYYSATRRRGPYIEYNGAALGDLAEAKLFGSKRGSYTSSVGDTKGLFRSAHKGVLFLDEIALMRHDTQGLLLRVLESHSVQPVGETGAEPIDVQLVLATNEDLPRAVAEGRFRHDLYARISALRINLKPLGSVERLADIRPLLTYFLARQEKEAGKKTGGLTPDAFRSLMTYSWPLNVREVDNVCAALVTHARHGEPISLSDVQQHCPEVVEGQRHQAAKDLEMTFISPDATYEQAYEAWHRAYILERLEQHGGSFARTAKSMGVHVDTLLRWRQKLGMTSKEESGDDTPVSGGDAGLGGEPGEGAAQA